MVLQESKQLAGGGPGQAAADLASALALEGAAGHIALGWLVLSVDPNDGIDLAF